MNAPSMLLRITVLALLMAPLTVIAWSLRAMTAADPDNGDVERWMEAGTDNVRRVASPLPQLLFLPPLESDDFWMKGAELHPFRERLGPDAKLTDLSALPGELDEVFYELLSTEGLLVIITERPLTPPKPRGAVWIRRHPHRHHPPDVSFWIKNLPAPSALRSIAFTLELLQEDGQLHWNTSRRFCSCY